MMKSQIARLTQFRMEERASSDALLTIYAFSSRRTCHFYPPLLFFPLLQRFSTNHPGLFQNGKFSPLLCLLIFIVAVSLSRELPTRQPFHFKGETLLLLNPCFVTTCRNFCGDYDQDVEKEALLLRQDSILPGDSSFNLFSKLVNV